MPHFLTTTLSAILAITVAGQASAADRGSDRFIREVGSLGAWYGVEVDHITLRDDTVLASGINRQGKRVTLVRACGQSNIVCPPALLAQLSREQQLASPSSATAGAAYAR